MTCGLLAGGHMNDQVQVEEPGRAAGRRPREGLRVILRRVRGPAGPALPRADLQPAAAVPDQLPGAHTGLHQRTEGPERAERGARREGRCVELAAERGQYCVGEVSRCRPVRSGDEVSQVWDILSM